MKYTDYNDEISPNKITVRVLVASRPIDRTDWWDLEDLKVIMDSCEKSVRNQKKFKDYPVQVFFMINDDYEMVMEFWGQRLETEEEFKTRQFYLNEQTKKQSQRDIDRLKHLASELGYKLIKK